MKKWLAIVCCLCMGWHILPVSANSQVLEIVQQLEDKSKDVQSVENEISVKNLLKKPGTSTEKEQMTKAKVIYDDSQQIAKLSAERAFVEPDNADAGMKLVYFGEYSDTYWWKDTETWHVSPLEKPINALYPDYFVHLKLVTDVLKKAEANGLEIKVEEKGDMYHLSIEDVRLDLLNAMSSAYEMSISGVEESDLVHRLQIVVNKKEGRMEKVAFEVEGNNGPLTVKIQSTNTYSNWNNVKDEEIVHPDNE